MNRLAVDVGGDFANAMRIAINPVAYIENLHEEGGNVDADIVPIHVEFWIALVVKDIGKCPNMEEMSQYDHLMENFVDGRMASVYGRTKYQGLKGFEPSEEVLFKAGLPLPRFNILRKYKADINMRNPVPHPNAILGKIVSCDIGSLLLDIISLDDSSIWCNTREATMGFADVAKAAIKNRTFGGKRGKLPLTAPQKAVPGMANSQLRQTTGNESAMVDLPVSKGEKQSPPSSGTPRGRPVNPNTPPISRTLREAQIPQKVVLPRSSVASSDLPVAPLSNPTIRKQQSKLAAKPPTTYKEGNTEMQPADLRNFCVCTALTVGSCNEEPTRQDYEALAKATTRYYTAHLQTLFQGTGMGRNNQIEIADISICKAEFESHKPSKHYNVYVEWNITVNHCGEERQPISMDLCDMRRVFVARVKTMDYLANYIRALRGTVFENTTGIYVGEPAE